MTRDETKALLGRTALLMFEHNGSSTLDGDKTLHIIDKIFDEHEAQLKAKECNETCKKYLSENGIYHLECGECSRFYSDGYEPKDNA